jgi:hypothetical protein
MKQDSRSPQQNRSFYPPPPLLPPDIESRVCIHNATLHRQINFKTDSFLKEEGGGEEGVGESNKIENLHLQLKSLISTVPQTVLVL